MAIRSHLAKESALSVVHSLVHRAACLRHGPALLFLLSTGALAHEIDAGVLETTIRAERPARSASELTLGAETLRAAPRNSAVDLLRLVPGMVASQHSGEGKAQQLFLRGFDAVHGQDVELQVAGLPVNDVSHLHALGYADLNWLIPDAVRAVRITEGSSRAWQGDFAVAGTVRYELGLDEPGLTVATSMGSFRRARLFAGLRAATSPETFVAAELVRGDGFGPQRAFSRASVLGQAVVPLGALTLRAVAASASGRFESPGVVREDALAAGRANFFDAFGAHQGGQSARHQLLLGASVLTDGARTNVELYGVLSDLTLRNNFTGFFSADGDGLEQRHRVGLVGLRVDHHRHLTLFGVPLSLDLGLGARRDGIDQRQRSYREVDGVALAPTIDVNIAQSAGNAWAELAAAPGGFRFMLGGRADAIGFDLVDRQSAPTRWAFGVHLGLKAAAERQLGDLGRLFLNYGDGFRSPQARGLADGEVAPFVNVRSAELGLALDWSRVSTKLVAFGSFVADDVFFDHTVGTTVSLGASWRGGVSLVVMAQPLQGWSLTGSATAAHAQVEKTGALLPYFAPLVGRLDTSYRREVILFSEKLTWRTGVGLTAIGPRPLPFGDFADLILLADARASLRWRHLELAVDAQNLFDSRWKDGAFTYPSSWLSTSRLPARHFTAGSPLSVFFTLELHP